MIFCHSSDSVHLLHCWQRWWFGRSLGRPM